MRKKLLKTTVFLASIWGTCHILRKYIQDITNSYEGERDRYMCYYYTIRQWLINKQEGKSVLEYLEKII